MTIVKFILAFVVYDFNDTSKVGPTARKQDTVLSLIVTPGAMTIFRGEGYNLKYQIVFKFIIFFFKNS